MLSCAVGVWVACCRYNKLHVARHAPYPALPFNDYRKVFVTDRMEQPDRPGPNNDGAATIMGNSVRQWHESYWPNKRRKLAQQAADEMDQYRSSLLDEGGYQPPADER